MSYATIESALATVLRTATGFDATNVVIGQFRPLASKKESVSLTPGAISGRRSEGNRTVTTDWVVQIQYFVKATDHANVEDVYATIVAGRQKLIDVVDKNPTLNGTAGVVIARITEADEPDWLQSGNSYIWQQMLRCMIRETVLITGGEFA